MASSQHATSAVALPFYKTFCPTCGKNHPHLAECPQKRQKEFEAKRAEYLQQRQRNAEKTLAEKARRHSIESDSESQVSFSSRTSRSSVSTAATLGSGHKLALSPDEEQEAWKMEKKLAEIGRLEERQARGEVLNDLQVAKIDSKAATESALVKLKVRVVQALPGQHLIATVKREQLTDAGWDGWNAHSDRCGGHMPGCQKGRDPCKHSDGCLEDFLKARKAEKQLGDIAHLEQRQAQGQVLHEKQVAKIESKAAIESGVAKLKGKEPPLSRPQLVALVKRRQKTWNAWEAWNAHSDRCGGSMPRCQWGRDPNKHCDFCLEDFLKTLVMEETL